MKIIYENDIRYYFIIIIKMTHKKISYDDVYLLIIEYTNILRNRYKELNKNIIHPTEEEYEKFIKDILEKATDVGQCLGIHMTGKHRNQRCKAVPAPGSKYCLRHQTQDLETKQFLEEAMKSMRKTKLND